MKKKNPEPSILPRLPSMAPVKHDMHSQKGCSTIEESLFATSTTCAVVLSKYRIRTSHYCFLHESTHPSHDMTNSTTKQVHTTSQNKTKNVIA